MMTKYFYYSVLYKIVCRMFLETHEISEVFHVNVNKRKHFPKRIPHVNRYLTKSHMDMIRTLSNNYDGFKLANYIYNNEIFLLKCALQNCLLNVS